MIPLKDNIRSRRFPLVNYIILGCTSVVFIAQLRYGDGGNELVQRFGMIPKRVLDPDAPVMVPTPVVHPRSGRIVLVEREAAPSPVPAWLTLLTCIFLHGGWLHFLGNMWFLYIFGDNVEDRLGHVGYTFFYLASGVLASATHLVTNLGSSMPTIGASGAIAGVMGAYFVLYPRARVLAAIPIIFYIEILVLPAPFFLAFWFLLQFFQGALSITSGAAGGVAWWAHIGGFLAGVLLVFGLRKSGVIPERSPDLLPDTDGTRYRHYGPRWPGR